jgi:integrase
VGGNAIDASTALTELSPADPAGDRTPLLRAIEHYQKHGKRHLCWVVAYAAYALFAGQRQSDVLGMMRSHVKDGLISVVQEKTGKRLWIPMHRDLLAIQAQTPRTSTNILTNSRGRPLDI